MTKQEVETVMLMKGKVLKSPSPWPGPSLKEVLLRLGQKGKKGKVQTP